MSKVYVKNGTPIAGPSLCESCSEAQIIIGFRESDVIVRCLSCYDQPLPVPFKVHSCSTYRDKNRPSWDAMEKFALVINETTSAKPAGFVFADDDDD